MKTSIFLKDVSIYAYHGVSPQETQVGNTFIINLRIETDMQKAWVSDHIADTISYADIYQSVSEEMSVPSQLLEHVAGRIIKRIFKEYPAVEAIELKIAKRNPPMGADIVSAGVEIQCNKNDEAIFN